MIHRRKGFVLVVALAIVAGSVCLPRAAQERPPPDDTRIHFRKTLFVHRTPTEKIFAETRKIRSGDVLWRILRDEYGVDEEAIPTLIAAYREINAGADPNLIYPGQVVRVPFKVEEDVSVPQAELAVREDTHYVRSGDTLWKILRDEYGVDEAQMSRALKQVAQSNPGLRDLNRLFVGQLLVIPMAPKAAPPPETAPEQTAQAPEPEEEVEEEKGLPDGFLSVLDVVERMRCTVVREGETFLPVARGRTLRLDAVDFPMVVGPTGDKVILDPRSHISAAMRETVESTWRYSVVQGYQDDPEAYLAELLPHLGFHELSEGARTIRLGEGVVITAQARWTVVPTAEDMWEDGMYLIFPRGVTVDPHLAALVKQRGFSILLLSTAQEEFLLPETDPATREAEVLSTDDGVSGAGVLLPRLGVDHAICPEVECELGPGVSYKMEPLLTFEHEGLRYAVPPATPARAETLLLKAGYFTFTWPESSTPLNRLGDLLALLAVKHSREKLELPEGAVRLEVEGLVVDNEKLAAALYEPWPLEGERSTRVLITEAELGPEAVAVLLRGGYLPWVVK